MRAAIAGLLLVAGHVGVGSASDDGAGTNAGRVYDPATGGLIEVEGERELPPRLSGYLEGLKPQVSAHWEPLLTSLQAERKIPKCFTGVRRTILAISLDAGGKATVVEIHRPSGVEALDEIAMLAVRRAQPFPPPPMDATDGDGVFRFSFGFAARGDAKWRSPTGSPSDPAVPVYVSASVTAPVALDAGCVASGIQLPADYRGQTPGSVSIRFAVGRDGVPREVEVLTRGTPAEVQAAIEAAVARCRWSPGLDETWSPKAMWVVMPVRFVRPVE